MNNIVVDLVSTDNLFNFKYKFTNDISEDNLDSEIYSNIGHTCEYFEVYDFQRR